MLATSIASSTLFTSGMLHCVCTLTCSPWARNSGSIGFGKKISKRSKILHGPYLGNKMAMSFVLMARYFDGLFWWGLVRVDFKLRNFRAESRLPVLPTNVSHLALRLCVISCRFQGEGTIQISDMLWYVGKFEDGKSKEVPYFIYISIPIPKHFPHLKTRG